MAKERLSKMEKAFHYLLESHHGTTPIEWLDGKRARITFPWPGNPDKDMSEALHTCDLPIDVRDNRVLVVVDGHLLPECFSHKGKLIAQEHLADLDTGICHVRKPEPYYHQMSDLPFVPHSRYDSTTTPRITVIRYFLLLPVKTNAVFVRPRDLRSLGPMYTFIEVDVENGKPVVRWRNTSW